MTSVPTYTYSTYSTQLKIQMNSAGWFARSFIKYTFLESQLQFGWQKYQKRSAKIFIGPIQKLCENVRKCLKQCTVYYMAISKLVTKCFCCLQEQLNICYFDQNLFQQIEGCLYFWLPMPTRAICFISNGKVYRMLFDSQNKIAVVQIRRWRHVRKN